MPASWPSPPSNGTPSSDGVLVRRVLEGDGEAYATLIRRHQEGLFRYARGLGIPREPAQDLVQDALIKAYRSLRTCADPERFEMWVFRILRNRALDFLKDIRRRSVNVDVLPIRDPAPDPQDETVRSELRQGLQRGLGQLPTDLRDAFLMKHLEGLSYDEMAELTGASVSALKMRVLRAREVLRESLAEQSIVSM